MHGNPLVVSPRFPFQKIVFKRPVQKNVFFFSIKVVCEYHPDRHSVMHTSVNNNTHIKHINTSIEIKI